MPSLLKYIDPENIPRYLGGTSDATLIDDAGPWNDPQIRAEIEEDMASRDAGGSQSEPPLASSPSRSTHLGAAQPLLGSTTTSFHRGSEANALPHVLPVYGVPAASTSQHSSPFAAQAHNAPFDADNAQVCLPLSNTQGNTAVQWWSGGRAGAGAHLICMHVIKLTG